MIVRIHGEGDYSFPAWLDGINGRFMASDGRANFSVELNDSFFSVLAFGPPPPTCQFTTSKQFGMTVNQEVRSEKARLTAELGPSKGLRMSIGSVSEELGMSGSGQVSNHFGKSAISAVSNQFRKSVISVVSEQFETSATRSVSSQFVMTTVSAVSQQFEKQFERQLDRRFDRKILF
jgi:hypothetical protein